MSVNLGMRDPDDLRWWGVNVSYYFYFVITFILSYIGNWTDGVFFNRWTRSTRTQRKRRRRLKPSGCRTIYTYTSAETTLIRIPIPTTSP